MTEDGIVCACGDYSVYSTCCLDFHPLLCPQDMVVYMKARHCSCMLPAAFIPLLSRCIGMVLMVKNCQPLAALCEILIRGNAGLTLPILRYQGKCRAGERQKIRVRSFKLSIYLMLVVWQEKWYVSFDFLFFFTLWSRLCQNLAGPRSCRICFVINGVK